MGLNQETYNSRREQGLCVQCAEPADGKSKCSGCATLDKVAREKRREKRKSQGLCTECNEPADPGYSLCPVCIGKQTSGALTRYYRNKTAKACRTCGGETENGQSRCPIHAAEFRAYQTERMNKKRASGVCLYCPEQARSGRRTCVRCAERTAARQKQERMALKAEVFDAYGGPVCVGCGETEIEILEIDHVGGGGCAHRRTIGISKTYSWLKKNGFPPGYRVLCPSCNKKAHRGLLAAEPT